MVSTLSKTLIQERPVLRVALSRSSVRITGYVCKNSKAANTFKKICVHPVFRLGYRTASATRNLTPAGAYACFDRSPLFLHAATAVKTSNECTDVY